MFHELRYGILALCVPLVRSDCRHEDWETGRPVCSAEGGHCTCSWKCSEMYDTRFIHSIPLVWLQRNCTYCITEILIFIVLDAVIYT